VPLLVSIVSLIRVVAWLLSLYLYVPNPTFSFLYPCHRALRRTSIGDRRKIKGRLIVASKSLLFDPDDWRHPVLRLAYRDTALVQAVPTSSQRGSVSGDGSAPSVCSVRETTIDRSASTRQMHTHHDCIFGFLGMFVLVVIFSLGVWYD
jgi:hypothetical protein